MISTQLLRRFPVFGSFSEEQLTAIARISEVASHEASTVIGKAGQPANALGLLMDGAVNLFHHDDILVGHINPGELFCLSALVPPHVLNASVHAAKLCQVLWIEGAPLRQLCQTDCQVGYQLMSHVAIAMLERLHYTRVELAAGRS